MAKGLRASTRKRNNAKLRATVFGPAYDARTERLSAKLQEIASQPRPDQERVMEVDHSEDKDNASLDSGTAGLSALAPMAQTFHADRQTCRNAGGRPEHKQDSQFSTETKSSSHTHREEEAGQKKQVVDRVSHRCTA